MPREALNYDVVIVGGGPAGLAAAIRLAQHARSANRPCSVGLIDKAAEIGGHILSGALLDPSSLDALWPEWRDGAPPHTPVTEERFLFLGKRRGFNVPLSFLPACLRNQGCEVISLGELCRHLAHYAESLGVDVLPGFAASDLLLAEDGAVAGVVTGDMGVLRDGSRGPSFQAGIELRAKYTLFAEGCRGNLGKRLMTRFNLADACSPQTYSLGIKELWEVPPRAQQPGLVLHTIGWPLASDTYGGGFVYHQADGRIAVGLITGLGYRNPYLSPFEEMQRLKTHPSLRSLFVGGRRIGFGARALTTGGLQALPGLVFPGGALIGDDAGFLNPARLKGIHAAITSGMQTADACSAALEAGRHGNCLDAYPASFISSALHQELHRARNVKPLFTRSLWSGTTLAAIDQKIFRGKAPWTLQWNAADMSRLGKRQTAPIIDYPPPDNVITFDRPSSVHLSSTDHAVDQPCHLKLSDPAVAIDVNLACYDAPEQRYCPAGVYEIVCADSHNARMQINAQNCLHCKACDIKDPTGNIEWTPPQGGDGPNYQAM